MAVENEGRKDLKENRLAVAENPNYVEYHPCLHRWLKENDEPSPEVGKPFGPCPMRINCLAEPSMRRLLEVYINYSHHLPHFMRENLLKKLTGFGFTLKLLEAMRKAVQLKKERMARICAGEEVEDEDEVEWKTMNDFDDDDDDDDGDDDGDDDELKTKKDDDDDNDDGGDNDDNDGLKRTKKKKKKKKKKDSVQLKGLKKKKKKKNSVQSKGSKTKKKRMGRGRVQTLKPGKPGQLNPSWPHETGLRILMLLLNLPRPDEEFIAIASAYFEVQTNALFKIISKAMDHSDNLELPSTLDETIALGCFTALVWIARNIISPADEIDDNDVEWYVAWKGEIPPKGSKNREEKKPKKGKNKKGTKRGSEDRRTITEIPQFDTKWQQVTEEIIQIAMDEVLTEDEYVESDVDLTISSFSEDEFQKKFVESSIWYNLLKPEFLMKQVPDPEKTVEYVNFNDEIYWKLSTAEDFDIQPFTANPIPEFFSRIRRNPNPKNDPWYVMTDPNAYCCLKSQWDTAYTLETIEMIAELIKTMVSMEQLSMKRMLELVAEICDAIDINANTNDSPEIELLDKKRMVVIERIFLNFFGKKFRDYNGYTCGYMETICKRAAVMIRYLYEHTALELWRYQRSPPPRLPTPEPEIVVKCFDEEMYDKWNDWLQWLLRAAGGSKRWKQWLLDATELDELPDDRTELIETAENWLASGMQIQNEAKIYKRIASTLEPIDGHNFEHSDLDNSCEVSEYEDA